MPDKQQLCKVCANQMYSDEIGNCKLCGSETASGAFKICAKCAKKWDHCQVCLMPLWNPRYQLKKWAGELLENKYIAAITRWLNGNSIWMFVGSLAVASLFFFGSTLSRPPSSSTYSVKLADIPKFGNNSVGIQSIDEFIRKHESKVSDLFLKHNGNTDLGRWISITDDDEDLGKFLEETNGILVFVKRGTMGLIEPIEFREAGKDNVKTWNLDIIHVADAHRMLGNTRQVVIGAVVDTGMDLNHPALRNRLVPGRDIIRNTDDPSNKTQSEMHATHVASTGIMDPKQSNGAFGVAYPVLKIMPVRVLNGMGQGTYQHIAKGIVWAVDHGAQIINLSLGGRYNSALLHDAIKYAVNKKSVLVIAAKGNSNTSVSHFPADYPEVLSVTATDRRDQRTAFSNYGENSGAAAPGKDIYGALPNRRFGLLSGTSMASPHVFAAAALIISQNPKLTPKQIRTIIERNGDKIKTDRPIGLRINLANFLKATEKLR